MVLPKPRPLALAAGAALLALSMTAVLGAWWTLARATGEGPCPLDNEVSRGSHDRRGCWELGRQLWGRKVHTHAHSCIDRRLPAGRLEHRPVQGEQPLYAGAAGAGGAAGADGRGVAGRQPGAHLRLGGRRAQQLWCVAAPRLGCHSAGRCPSLGAGPSPPYSCRHPIAPAPALPPPAVADPFLLQGSDGLYLFYETKTTAKGRGEIGVARSADGGASFQHLGVALSEPWHLSYPFVFEHGGQVGLRCRRAGAARLVWSGGPGPAGTAGDKGREKGMPLGRRASEACDSPLPAAPCITHLTMQAVGPAPRASAGLHAAGKQRLRQPAALPRHALPAGVEAGEGGAVLDPFSSLEWAPVQQGLERIPAGVQVSASDQHAGLEGHLGWLSAGLARGCAGAVCDPHVYSACDSHAPNVREEH